MGWIRRWSLPIFMVAGGFAGGQSIDLVVESNAEEEPRSVSSPDEASQPGTPSARWTRGARPHRLALPPPSPELAEGLQDLAALSVDDILERACVEENLLLRQDLIHAALTRIPPEDLEAALAWVERFPNRQDQTFLQREVLNRLGESDPERAMQLALALPGGFSRRDIGASVFRRWSRNEPEDALQWALDQPDNATRARFMRSAIMTIASDDVERAYDLTDSLRPGEAAQTRASLLDRWAAADPVAAAERMEALPVGTARHDSIGSIARRWAEADPEAALAWARRLPRSREREHALETVALTQAFQNPQVAFEVMSRLDEVPPRSLGTIAAEWIRVQPETALATIEAMPAGPARRYALESAVDELAREAPRTAARLAKSLQPGPNRTGLMDHIAAEMANEDVRDAARWALQLQGEEQSSAVSVVVARWATDEPLAAARFVQGLPAGETRDQALADMVQSWSYHAPGQAAEWLRDHSGSRQAYRDVVAQWSQFDLESAEQWVDSLGAGPAADSAASAMASSLSREDPASAWAWASNIEDQGDREVAYASVARAWLEQDPELARAEIEIADVSPAARARMLGEDYTPPEPDCACLLAADLDQRGLLSGEG